MAGNPVQPAPARLDREIFVLNPLGEQAPRVLDAIHWDLLGSSGRRIRQEGFLGTLRTRRHPMAWTRPKLREICIGMEINGYFAGKM